MAGSLIGIDVGNDSCKFAVRDGGQVRFISGQLPDNLVADGEIVSLQTLGEYMHELRRENGVNGRDCSIVLDEQVLFFRHISMPLMTIGEFKLNLPFEFRDFIEGDPQKLYL